MEVEKIKYVIFYSKRERKDGEDREKRVREMSETKWKKTEAYIHSYTHWKSGWRLHEMWEGDEEGVTKKMRKRKERE